MNDKISNKDKQDWENFLSGNEKLSDKDFHTTNIKKRGIKRVDLHGFSLTEANRKIERLIKDSYENQLSKIIVVTGKGLHSNVQKNPYVSKDLSILKYSVPEFIKNNVELMKKIKDIKNADIDDGGNGAFYIFLKKK